MKPFEILVTARAVLADPAKWGKGVRGENRPDDTYCVMDALYAEPNTRCGDALDACALIKITAGETEEYWRAHGIADWNDAPERTHAEVLAALDRAIQSHTNG